MLNPLKDAPGFQIDVVRVLCWDNYCVTCLSILRPNYSKNVIYILFFEVKGKYFMASGRMFMFASKYMRKGKQNAKRQKTISSESEPAWTNCSTDLNWISLFSSMCNLLFSFAYRWCFCVSSFYILTFVCLFIMNGLTILLMLPNRS